MFTSPPPVSTLEIFARNRMKDGWSKEQVIAAIRKRCRLDDADVKKMTALQRERYWDAVRFVERLEEQQGR